VRYCTGPRNITRRPDAMIILFSNFPFLSIWEVLVLRLCRSFDEHTIPSLETSIFPTRIITMTANKRSNESKASRRSEPKSLQRCRTIDTPAITEPANLVRRCNTTNDATRMKEKETDDTRTRVSEDYDGTKMSRGSRHGRSPMIRRGNENSPNRRSREAYHHGSSPVAGRGDEKYPNGRSPDDVRRTQIHQLIRCQLKEVSYVDMLPSSDPQPSVELKHDQAPSYLPEQLQEPGTADSKGWALSASSPKQVSSFILSTMASFRKSGRAQDSETNDLLGNLTTPKDDETPNTTENNTSEEDADCCCTLGPNSYHNGVENDRERHCRRHRRELSQSRLAGRKGIVRTWKTHASSALSSSKLMHEPSRNNKFLNHPFSPSPYIKFAVYTNATSLYKRPLKFISESLQIGSFRPRRPILACIHLPSVALIEILSQVHPSYPVKGSFPSNVNVLTN
jgi:hypothetical protein